MSAYENQLAVFSVSMSAGSDIIDKVLLMLTCSFYFIMEVSTLLYLLEQHLKVFSFVTID